MNPKDVLELFDMEIMMTEKVMVNDHKIALFDLERKQDQGVLPQEIVTAYEEVIAARFALGKMQLAKMHQGRAQFVQQMAEMERAASSSIVIPGTVGKRSKN